MVGRIGSKLRVVLPVAVLVSGAGCQGLEGDVLVRPDIGPGETPPPGAAIAGCPGGSSHVLALSADGLLASFDPTTGELHDRASISASIPAVDCGSGGPGRPPVLAVAMAVDREGSAWVIDCTGDLLKCDAGSGFCFSIGISDRLPRPQRMAWITDAGGAQTLYLALPVDGVMAYAPPPRQSALVKLPRWGELVTTLAGWPALAGRGTELWGLFPSHPTLAVTTRLARIDLHTGLESEQRPAHDTIPGTTTASLVHARGEFFVFEPFGLRTEVWRIPPDGPATMVRSIRRSILAAASSPCGT